MNDYTFDKSEYGDVDVTTEQYKFVAERLCQILNDDDEHRYRMLLVEFSEKKVLSLLGSTLVYYGEPLKESFWANVESERDIRKSAKSS